MRSEMDEKLLYDTFSAFGVIAQTPKIMRDPDTGNSRGFGFVSYDSFEASDAAIEAMNGQFLCNRPISVTYAYKKDTKGERHGTAAERLIAAQNKAASSTDRNRPHTNFASAPAGQPPPPLAQPPPPPGGPGMPPQGLMPPTGMLPPGMPPLPGMYRPPGPPPVRPTTSSTPSTSHTHLSPPGQHPRGACMFVDVSHVT
jgi:splicing factor 3B subunit 4